MGKIVDGAKVRALRERMGKNQTDFAAAAGVSKRTIIRFENSESITTSNIQKVAKALGLSQWTDLVAPTLVEVPRPKRTLSGWEKGALHFKVREYLAAVRKQLGAVMPVVADHPSDIQPPRLTDLFVAPLLATREITPDADAKAISANGGEGKELAAVVMRHPRIVLLGPGGMGKSTVVAWIADTLANPDPHALKDAIGDLIPVPLILRDLKIGEVVTWDGLLAAFRETTLGANLTPDDWTALTAAMAEGRVYFLLDGFDEIPGAERRAEFVRAIHDGMAGYPKCRWMATSRIVGYEQAEIDPLEERDEKDDKAGRTRGEGRGKAGAGGRRLTESHDVAGRPRPLKLTPLGRESSEPALQIVFDYSLDQGFFQKRAGEFERYYVVPFDDDRIREYAEGWYAGQLEAEEAAARAIDLVRAVTGNDNTLQLARVPHWLALMAVIHKLYAVLPDGRLELYRRIAEACLFTIPLKRRFQVPYPVEEQMRWWGVVGFTMQQKRKPGAKAGEALVSITLAELRKALEEAWKLYPPQVPPADRDQAFEVVIEFMKYRAGMLNEHETARFRFMHLSFQEFFAAWHLAGQVERPSWWRKSCAAGTSVEELRGYAGGEHWLETFLLAFEKLSKASEPDLTTAFSRELFGDFEKVNGTQALLLQRLGTDTSIKWSDEALPAQATARYTNWLIDEQRGKTPRDKLTELSLDQTGVSDLRPLQNLTALHTLYLNQTGVSDLRPLQNLTALRYLYLSQIGVSEEQVVALKKRLPKLTVRR